MGRRYEKKYKDVITKFVWDGNTPLHEWVETPERSLSEAEKTTWIFDADSFVPSAKLVGENSYSIVSDYLGTPCQAYSENGNKVWEYEQKSYGGIDTLQGAINFIPFRYQGQYEDVETGLYYNRFRYYSPEEECYISQDPIRLAGGFELYGYVKDSNSWIDTLGLSEFIPPSAELTPFPDNLLFGQHRISPNFSSQDGVPTSMAGRSISDVAEDVKLGNISTDDFLIRYTKLPDGRLVTLNNRGLATLTMSGKTPEFAVYIPYKDAKKSLLKDVDVIHPKLKTKGGTNSIHVTGQKDGGDKRYTVTRHH